MGSLVDTVRDPQKRSAVLDDCVKLIDAEVADKRGLTGVAVKAAFKSVKSLRPGMIRQSMDALLDDFSSKVEPFWQDCQQSSEAPRVYFGRRKSDVANALLSITDQRAQTSKHRVLVKAYKSLRGKAIEHIGDAMPRFADLLDTHAR
jgi:hypothetical protein